MFKPTGGKLTVDAITRKLRREIVRGTVAHQIQCKLSGEVLDMRRAVVLTLKRGNRTVDLALTGEVYDGKRAELEQNARDMGMVMEVIDGRELW